MPLLKYIDKILPLPLHFDENEWFILINLLGFLWVIFLPKRFPKVITILIVLFGMSIAKIMDHAIAVPPLDLYDINDKPEYEFFDDLGYLMYTPYAYLAVYLFDKFKPKGLQITLYIFLMAVAGVLFEWLAVHFHVFTYKGWTLFYSFPVYLGVATLHLLFSTFLMNYFKDSTINRQDL